MLEHALPGNSRWHREMGTRVPNSGCCTSTRVPKKHPSESNSGRAAFERDRWESLKRRGLVPSGDCERAIAQIAVHEEAREKNAAEQQRARRISARRSKCIDSDSYTHHVDTIVCVSAELEAERARAKRGRRPNRTRSRAARIAAHARARAENEARNRERKERYERRMREQIEKFEAELKACGQLDARPRGIPPRTWRLMQMCGDVRHYSLQERQHAARIALAKLPKPARERVLRAAFHPKPYQATRRFEGRALHECERESLPCRSWSHPTALKTILAALLMWELGEVTRRRGFCKVVRGFGRGVFGAFLQDWATGHHASVASLYGASREVPAPMLALKQAGFVYYHQPPAHVVTASDRGPSGHAYNVYWVHSTQGAEGPTLSDGFEPQPPGAWLVLGHMLEDIERAAPF